MLETQHQDTSYVSCCSDAQKELLQHEMQTVHCVHAIIAYSTQTLPDLT